MANAIRCIASISIGDFVGAHSGRVFAFTQNLKVIGHRGSPKQRPENTIVSFERAREEGVDAIEFDVTLTKDGVPILLHDETLDRTTNFTGQISEYLLCDLQQCDFAIKYREKSGDTSVGFTSVCTAEDIIKWALGNKMKMFFDIKNTDSLMEKTVDKLFRKYNLYDWAVVSSLYPKIIYNLKRKNPRILVSFAWCHWTYSYLDLYGKLPCYPDSIVKQKATELLDVVNVWCASTWLPYFLGADIVLTERTYLSEAYVRQHESAGRCVIVWSVNDTMEARWINKVLRIPLITDLPGRIVTAINSTAAEVSAEQQ